MVAEARFQMKLLEDKGRIQVSGGHKEDIVPGPEEEFLLQNE